MVLSTCHDSIHKTRNFKNQCNKNRLCADSFKKEPAKMRFPEAGREAVVTAKQVPT